MTSTKTYANFWRNVFKRGRGVLRPLFLLFMIPKDKLKREELKKIRRQRDLVGLELTDRDMRKCLSCDKKFVSHNKANRICRTCKQTQARNNVGEFVDESFHQRKKDTAYKVYND